MLRYHSLSALPSSQSTQKWMRNIIGGKWQNAVHFFVQEKTSQKMNLTSWYFFCELLCHYCRRLQYEVV